MNCYPESTYAMYADGEVPAEEARAIQAHLSGCRRCWELVEALREENRALTALFRQVDEAPVRAGIRPNRAIVWKSAALAAAAVILSTPIQWVTGHLPRTLEWLNPLSGPGRMNVLFEFAFYLKREGASVVSSILDVGIALLGCAVLAWVVYMLWRNRHRASNASLSAFLVLALSVPGFSMTKRTGQVVVSKGETLNDTLLATGETIRVEGTVDGDVIAVGKNVEIRGVVKGNAFIWAQELEMKGEIEGSLVVFAQTVRVSGQVDHNLYGGVQFLRIEPEGHIVSELWAAAESLNLDGHVDRGALLGGAMAEARGTVGRNLAFYGHELRIASSARVGGNLVGEVDHAADLHVESGASIAGKTDVRVKPHTNRLAKASFYYWKVAWLVVALLFAWLALAMFPGFFRRATAAVGQWGRSMGIGAGVLVGTPIAVILLCITLVGIPLGAGLLGLYILGLFLAKILVAGFLGQSLFPPRTSHTSALLVPLAIGLVFLTVVLELPYGVGTIAGALVACFGLGALTLEIFRAGKAGPPALRAE